MLRIIENRVVIAIFFVDDQVMTVMTNVNTRDDQCDDQVTTPDYRSSLGVTTCDDMVTTHVTTPEYRSSLGVTTCCDDQCDDQGTTRDYLSSLGVDT
jgi:hypothetical protein